MNPVTLRAPLSYRADTVWGTPSGLVYTLDAHRRVAVADPADAVAMLRAGFELDPGPLDQLLVALTMRGVALPDDPGGDVVPVVSSEAFPVCRALLVGTAGTATLVTAAGETRPDVPLQQGFNPIRASMVTLGTAADVWAVY